MRLPDKPYSRSLKSAPATILYAACFTNAISKRPSSLRALANLKPRQPLGTHRERACDEAVLAKRRTVVGQEYALNRSALSRV